MNKNALLFRQRPEPSAQSVATRSIAKRGRPIVARKPGADCGLPLLARALVGHLADGVLIEIAEGHGDRRWLS